MKECTVTFHSEGNSDSTIKVAYNQTVAKPADPQKEGSIFYGWFLDGVEFDFNKPIQKDIELIGKWLETGIIFISLSETGCIVGDTVSIIMPCERR